MEQRKVLLKAGVLLFSLLLLPGLTGCGTISSLLATPTSTATSTPAATLTPSPVLGIDRFIIKKDVSCTDPLTGHAISEIIQFRFMEVVVHNGDKFPLDTYRYPSTPNNVFVDLKYESEGYCSLDWIAKNSVLICDNIEYSVGGWFIDFNEQGKVMGHYIRFETPKDVRFQECLIRAGDVVVPLAPLVK
ncbi:MAG: hypothetical protein QXD70_02590 [Candidatus Bathyarchaeia archaeon]